MKTLLSLLLVVLPAVSAQDAAMKCANVVSVQTRAVQGPRGTSAVLRVSSEDDHAKDHHDCMAKYEVTVRGTRSTPVQSSFLRSDGDWERRLSIHLDGFSADGKRVFGILRESGSVGFPFVFEVNAFTGGGVQLYSLKKQPKPPPELKCGSTFAVAGTTEAGKIVLRPNSAEPCGQEHRWVIQTPNGDLRPLGKGESVVSLFNAK